MSLVDFKKGLLSVVDSKKGACQIVDFNHLYPLTWFWGLCYMFYEKDKVLLIEGYLLIFKMSCLFYML